MSQAASANDRLLFTLFLAAVSHAIIIGGLSFAAPEQAKKAPSLSVTLVNSQSKNEDEADYLAEFEQQGSGSTDEAKELTSPYDAPLDAATAKEVAMQMKSEKEQKVTIPRLLTSISSSKAIQNKPEEIAPDVEQQEQEHLNPAEEESFDIDSMMAEYAAMVQQYAKRPKVRSISTLSTKSHEDASYLQHFRGKIERIATSNFPNAAIAQNQFGEVSLKVVIRNNGTVESVEVVKSSGFSFLDEAARRSVNLAAPFNPFSKEQRKTTDILEIFATWKYDEQRVVKTTIGG